MNEINIFMRFLHIVSATALLGGVIAWRFALIPATEPMAVDMRARIGNAVAAAWRPVFLASVAGLLVSGIYSYLRKTGLTPAYHAVIGIKFLLALHVFAVGFLATTPNNDKRKRQLTGVVISGVAILILAAVLRSFSLAQ